MHIKINNDSISGVYTQKYYTCNFKYGKYYNRHIRAIPKVYLPNITKIKNILKF